MTSTNAAQGNPPRLLFECEGSIAKLTLNRADAANALDLSTARELMRAAITCDENEAIRCVLLTGTGRFFCAGGDVRSLGAAGASLGALLKEMTAYFHAAVTRFMRMNKPLIIAVNGIAAGAGFSLALVGDLVLAARTAQFTSSYTMLGLSCDGGLSWILPRLMGLRRAQELLLTNRTLSAEEAMHLGLVTRTTDAEALSAEASTLAQELAAGPTAAYGKLRNLLLCSSESSLETQLESESRAIAQSSRTPHGQEGIAAFASRRKPDFSR